MRLNKGPASTELAKRRKQQSDQKLSDKTAVITEPVV